MRRNTTIEDIWNGGDFAGLRAASTYITVSPEWVLTSANAPGTQMIPRRQPARWYQDTPSTVTQLAVPLSIVRRIRIDRQINTDAAQLTMTVRNADPAGGINVPEQGRYSQRRSVNGATLTATGEARWPELEPNEWSTIYTAGRAHGYGYLAQGNMLRTYQGYGAWEVDATAPDGRTAKSLEDALADGNVVQTGAWIIDEVDYDHEGNIEINARDVMALLIDQKLYPPFVPTGCYPTQFYSRTWNTEAGYGPNGKVPSSTNYKDLSDIIRLFAIWGGFYLPGGDLTAGGRWPAILGGIEDTGIDSTSVLTADMFDKKDVIDGMKAVAQMVAYELWVDQEGGLRFHSPNIWEAGNFDYDGAHSRFAFDIDENRTLTSYRALGTKRFDRSSIAAAVADPYLSARGHRAKHATFDTWTSSTKNQLHGMVSPAIIAVEHDIPLSEMVTIAELTGLRTWFQRRRGTWEAPALPLIDRGDQVRIWERVTFDHYLHRVETISTEHDIEQGTYKMNGTSHWLGADNEDWKIRVGPGGHVIYNINVPDGGTTLRHLRGGHVQHPYSTPTLAETVTGPWSPD